MEVRAQIRGFISDTFFVDDFGDEESFLQTGIIDSTGMMELIAFIQRAFGIEVGDAELVPENFDSVDNVCLFIRRQPRAA